jgi:hypothetical protein
MYSKFKILISLKPFKNVPYASPHRLHLKLSVLIQLVMTVSMLNVLGETNLVLSLTKKLVASQIKYTAINTKSRRDKRSMNSINILNLEKLLHSLEILRFSMKTSMLIM